MNIPRKASVIYKMLYKYGFVTQDQLIDIALKANINEFILPKTDHNICLGAGTRQGKKISMVNVLYPEQSILDDLYNKIEFNEITLVKKAIPKPTAEVTNLHNYRKQRGK
jgi:hypothetical protein